MKKILYIVFAAALVAVSCTQEPGINAPVVPDEGLTLTFYSKELTTRAEDEPLTADGVNNENLVKRIDYFIFPADEEGVVADETEYVFKGELVPESQAADGHYSTKLEPTPDEFRAIFPNGAKKAMVFAIVNYVDQFGDNNSIETPNTTLPEDVKSWGALHELEVGPTFFYDDGTEDFGLRWPHVLATDSDDLFFVMTGEAVLDYNSYDSSKKSFSATVPLKRLASKVSVNFTYENVRETKDNNIIEWVPQESAGETRVYLSNAIEHTTIGGPLSRSYVADSWTTATKPLGNGTRDVFEYAYNFMNDVPVIDNKKTAHFYTYPIAFPKGDDNQPFLKLVLPWYGYKYIGSATNPTFDPEATDFAQNWILYKQKEVYYKIALPSDTIDEPNYIYEYSVNVNIIGSDREVLIDGDYVVKDWLNNGAISSNVATGRYISLDIPRDEYDMYTDEIEIAFVSSGTVIAQIDEIYQMNYSSANTSRDYFMRNDAVTATQDLRNRKGITNDDILGWVSIPAETSYLKISHEMDNRMTINNQANSACDMAPYVFKVTLHLEEAGNDTSFDRTVTVTQYPALYVVSRPSNGYAFVNGYGIGNCYDDNNGGLGNLSNAPGSLNGTGTNDNPNNYIITTSILSEDLTVRIANGNAAPDDGTYHVILGDPRSTTVNNLTNLGGLSNYRPTNRTGTETMIAPKLIVASSYGVSTYFGRDAAEKRCAAYQESGYPAGRWRAPTLAEVSFMMTLSNMGFIPSLYRLGANDGEGYWCANGKVSGDANRLPYLSNNNDNTAVRCVYDAWYWGEEPYDENATTWMGFHD